MKANVEEKVWYWGRIGSPIDLVDWDSQAMLDVEFRMPADREDAPPTRTRYRGDYSLWNTKLDT